MIQELRKEIWLVNLTLHNIYIPTANVTPTESSPTINMLFAIYITIHFQNKFKNKSANNSSKRESQTKLHFCNQL